MRIRMRFKCCFAIIFGAVTILLCSCNITPDISEEDVLSRTEFAFDTVIKISIYENGTEEILDNCISLCRKMEDILSPTKQESELYKINYSNSTGADKGRTYKLSRELREVVDRGLYYSRLSEGLFDITIRPVSKLWDFKGKMQEPPDSEAIADMLRLVDYEKVYLDEKGLCFEEPEMAVDCGAIAKGYIADEIKSYLLRTGVTSAVINLGGNVLCVGKRPDGDEFRIGVQSESPREEALPMILRIDDKSVVTSGIYERYFEHEGKIYHHILDTEDGYPHDNSLSYVTVISDRSVDGDALSTLLFLAGEEKGLEIIREIGNIEAVFVHKDGKRVFSEGFEKYLERTE